MQVSMLQDTLAALALQDFRLCFLGATCAPRSSLDSTAPRSPDLCARSIAQDLVRDPAPGEEHLWSTGPSTEIHHVCYRSLSQEAPARQDDINHIDRNLPKETSRLQSIALATEDGRLSTSPVSSKICDNFACLKASHILLIAHASMPQRLKAQGRAHL